MKKNLKNLTIILSLFTAASASADSQCLRQASNQELLNEVSIRMGSPGNPNPGNDLSITAYCDSGLNLHLNVTNLNSGQTQESTSYIGSSCSSFQHAIQAKADRLSRGGQVAYCDSGLNLHTVTITRIGQILENTSYLGSSCREQADIINR